MNRREAPEPTPIVDLWVDLRHADPRDLVTLGRLGTRAVVGRWGSPSRGEIAPLGAKRLERALSLGLARLETAGLGGGLCLGIGPDQIPTTGRERLLARLPEFLGAPGVLGIGPIGPGAGELAERRVFEAQLALGFELRRPVLVDLPLRRQSEAVSTLVAATRAAHLPPEQVVVLHGQIANIQNLHSLGFICALDAIPPQEAAALASRLGAASLVLGSGVGAGPTDLLSGRRILALARDSGLSPAACRALAGGTAAKLFGLSLP